MRTARLLVLAALMTVSTAPALRAAAHDALALARAAELADPRRAGAPFELVAHGTVRDLGAGGATTCAYHLTWLSATAWREEMQLGEYTLERGAVGGSGWRLVAGGPTPLAALELRDLLDIPGRFTRASGETVVSAKKLRLHGRDIVLVVLAARGGRERSLYIDGQAGVPLAEARGNEKVEYAGWRHFDGGLYPGAMLLGRDGEVVLELTVDELTNVAANASAVAAPEGALAACACERPEPAVPVSSPPPAAVAVGGGRVTLVCEVDGGGIARLVRVGRTSGSTAADEAAAAVRGWHFVPARCGDAFVPSEVAVTLSLPPRQGSVVLGEHGECREQVVH